MARCIGHIYFAAETRLTKQTESHISHKSAAHKLVWLSTWKKGVAQNCSTEVSYNGKELDHDVGRLDILSQAHTMLANIKLAVMSAHEDIAHDDGWMSGPTGARMS